MSDTWTTVVVEDVWTCVEDPRVTFTTLLNPTIEGGPGGTSDHRALTHRDAADQHPIDAIEGLAEALAASGLSEAEVSALIAAALSGATYMGGVLDGSLLTPGFRTNMATQAELDDLSGVTDPTTARTNLGLGSAATADAGDFATAAQGALADTAVQPGGLAAVATSGAYADLSGRPSIPDSPDDIGAAPVSHAHAAGDLTSGVLDIARIPVGTTSTTVMRGDSPLPTGWASPVPSGGVGSDVWFLAPGAVGGGTLGTVAVAANNVWYAPILVPRAITITAAAVRCTTGVASSLARAAIVSADSTWQPAARVHEFSTFDCSTSGVKSQTGLTVTLPAGRYLVALKTEGGAPTLAQVTAQSPVAVITALSAGGAVTHWSGTTGTSAGAYADPPPSWTSFGAGYHFVFFRWSLA